MQQLFTRADYDKLPEGFPAQLIEGSLVKEPAPTDHHQRIETRILAHLAALVGPDRAIPSPTDVGIDDHNVYQPDIVVLRDIPPDHARDVGIPLLAVEVLSPSTRKRDREVKTRHLIRAGVEEVWLVDPEAAALEVHRADGPEAARGDTPLVSRALPGFSLTPATLFTPAAGT
jgi:Uma2 family endonuclease